MDASSPCPPGYVWAGGGSGGGESWLEQAQNLFSQVDPDLISDWDLAASPYKYNIYLTNDQYDLLAGSGFLQGSVLVQQLPRAADKVLTVGAGVIAGILAWWEGTQKGRLYTCEVRCGVHKNGTANHEVVGVVTGVGVGTTPQQARNAAVSNANANAVAQYGQGHHAIHCTPGKYY